MKISYQFSVQSTQFQVTRLLESLSRWLEGNRNAAINLMYWVEHPIFRFWLILWHERRGMRILNQLLGSPRLFISDWRRLWFAIASKVQLTCDAVARVAQKSRLQQSLANSVGE